MSLTAGRPRETKSAAKSKREPMDPKVKGIHKGREYAEGAEKIFASKPKAKAIDESVNKNRVVPDSAFMDHINKTVVESVLGQQLHPDTMRMLIHGIADQCLELADQGYRVRIPNLVVMEKSTRKATTARNIHTGQSIDVPATNILKCKPAPAAKAFMAASNE